MNMDPGTWSARVVAAIRSEMATQQRSGKALAHVLGVTEPTVATRLDGETTFDLVEIERIAGWLGMSPSELIARADDRAA